MILHLLAFSCVVGYASAFWSKRLVILNCFQEGIHAINFHVFVICVNQLCTNIILLAVIQGAISCGTALPPVAASAGALTLAGSPSIRAFVAKSILSRFTRFWMYHFQSQHTRFCREISFVALLGISFSAIHGDGWLFHDYDASAVLPMLAQSATKTLFFTIANVCKKFFLQLHEN